MANKRIHELTSDIGVDVVGNDLLAVDKYVSPGVYTTVFKNSDNVRNYISSYVTGLSTVSFTNINTSINAVKPDIYDELHLHTVTSASHTVTTAGSVELKCNNVYPTPFAGKVLLLVIKMFATATSGESATGEYRVSIKSTGPSILGSTVDVYTASDAGIGMRAAPFSTGTDGGGNIWVRTYNNHSIGAGSSTPVTFTMVVEAYGYTL